ncbi:MAG: methyltransferase domain-containing protein [Campylobacterales bacterium]|nr:methyltransferase domain-containing protein [Campylobacterales bacterium]
MIKTNIDEIDFSDLYNQQKKISTFESKTKEDWDNKAPYFQEKIYNSAYNDSFIKKINLSDCKTMIDFGCGVGNLSIRLAKKLKSVTSIDYSKEMLNYLEKNAKEEKTTNVKTLNLSWEDDWSEVPKSDLFIASRSFTSQDLKTTIEKISSVANKRVYLSTNASSSYVSDEIANLLEKDIIGKPNFVYIINALFQMGYFPKIDYIDGFSKRNRYNTPKEFIDSIVWSVGQISDVDKKNLTDYFYTLKEEINGQRYYEEKTKWALISWEVFE